LALRLGGGKRPSGKGVVSEGERQDQKKVIKFTSWVGLRNLERPEPSYITDKRELPSSTELHDSATLACISGCQEWWLLIQFNCDLNARDKERTTALIRLRSTFFAYWAENTQEKLQLSSKDKEEDMVAELGASNGSCTDSLRVLRRRL
ncbi:hypothetical protein Cadr_000011600, partial [Camelus dromedarius]